MSNAIDINRYAEFVNGITSAPSKDFASFLERIKELQSSNIDVPRLLTSAIGMPSEAGEFSEIVKKLIFHGKEFTPDMHTHLVKELGDVIWYWVVACIALNVNPNDVIKANVDKLMNRYPGGEFNIHQSNVRKDGDI